MRGRRRVRIERGGFGRCRVPASRKAKLLEHSSGAAQQGLSQLAGAPEAGGQCATVRRACVEGRGGGGRKQKPRYGGERQAKSEGREGLPELGSCEGEPCCAVLTAGRDAVVWKGFWRPKVRLEAACCVIACSPPCVCMRVLSDKQGPVWPTGSRARQTLHSPEGRQGSTPEGAWACQRGTGGAPQEGHGPGRDGQGRRCGACECGCTCC